jgi:hypothetical protein
MLIRKFFVGFFILLFCFQLVPVKQMGLLLYSNQITEEVTQGQETEQFKYPDDNIKYLLNTQNLIFKRQFSTNLFQFDQRLTVQIITRISDDIQTPPPNNIG